MRKPETDLENKTHKIPWDFEIQTDHPTQARRPDLIFINHKNEPVVLWILLYQLTTESK